MKIHIAMLAFAATLSAQQSSSFVDRYDARSVSTVRLNPGVYIVDPPPMVSTESWRGPSPWATSAPATSFDGNGALEAFYKTHHSHRKAWLTVGILIGSGVATGILASRSARPPIGRPIMPAMPASVTPVFRGVTFIGIGGPGVPVVISKGGAN